jgi:hypothetical protein
MNLNDDFSHALVSQMEALKIILFGAHGFFAPRFPLGLTSWFHARTDEPRYGLGQLVFDERGPPLVAPHCSWLLITSSFLALDHKSVVCFYADAAWLDGYVRRLLVRDGQLTFARAADGRRACEALPSQTR